MASRTKFRRVVTLEEYKKIEDRMHMYFNRSFYQSWLISCVLNLGDAELEDLYNKVLAWDLEKDGDDDDEDLPFPDEV